VEKVLDHSPEYDHQGVEAAEKDPDHSPESDHQGVEAVERDLDRSPKLKELCCGMRKLSRHSPRPNSATPSLQLKQATPKRLLLATLTYVPPSGETNPEALYAVLSHNGTELALCLNGKLPWTMARWTEVPDQYGPVSFKLSICRIRFGKGRVKGTIVLLVRGLNTYSLNQIGAFEDDRPTRHCLSCWMTPRCILTIRCSICGPRPSVFT
jgi:hypothetical protein